MAAVESRWIEYQTRIADASSGEVDEVPGWFVSVSNTPLRCRVRLDLVLSGVSLSAWPDKIPVFVGSLGGVTGFSRLWQ
jgi:hypothetical protein